MISSSRSLVMAMLTLCFLLPCFAHAYNSNLPFDSCEPITWDDGILDDITGNRLAALISQQFCMTGAGSACGAGPAAFQGLCQETNGTSISFQLNGQSYTLGQPGSGDDTTIANVNASTIAGSTIPVTIRTRFYNNLLCAQALLPTGFRTIGCVQTQVPVTVTGGSQNCYLDTSCYNQATHSQLPSPMSALLVECVLGTLNNVFSNPNACSGGQNYLANFQANLRASVLAALMLYVILFGINTMLSPENIQKSMVFQFIIKMVLVVYFSVGFVTDNPSATPNAPATVTYSNGLAFLYNASIQTSMWLGDLLLDTGQTNGLCNFQPSDYDQGYQHLAMWDGLDCRLAYYFGFVQIGAATAGSGGPLAFSTPGMLGIVVPVLVGGLVAQFVGVGPAVIGFLLLFGILLLVVMILMISLVLFVLNIYLIAFLAITLLIFLAPLFVPMVLFEHTKQFFEKWRTLVIGFTIQPALFLIMMGMMFSVFDSVLYGSCQFQNQSSNALGTSQNIGGGVVGTSSKSFPYFGITNGNSTGDYSACSMNFSNSNPCYCTLGYQLATYEFLTSAGSNINGTIPFFGFALPFIIFTEFTSILVQIFISILVMAFFAYLFYYFAGFMSKVIADLTSSGSLAKHAMRPAALLLAAGKGVSMSKDYLAGKINDKPDKATPETTGRTSTQGSDKATGAAPQRTGTTSTGGANANAIQAHKGAAPGTNLPNKNGAPPKPPTNTGRA